MPAKTPKITDAQIQSALDRWLKGEGRAALIVDMKLPLTRGELAQRFRDLSGKSRSELNDMRKGGGKSAKKGSRKPKTARTSSKSKEEGATEFTKAPSKAKGKAGKEESDAPAARRKAA